MGEEMPKWWVVLKSAYHSFKEKGRGKENGKEGEAIFKQGRYG
jgi:hypothetical protein